jgi:hypothetical protein
MTSHGIPTMRGNHPPTLDDVAPVGSGVLQHPAQIDLVEVPVEHPLEKMRAELELPVPPRGPSSRRQIWLLS